MRGLAVGLLVLVVACSDPTNPSAPPVVGISPTVQWSGGEVVIQGRGLQGSPTIVVGAETLTVSRLNDSTLSVRLPILPSGHAVLQSVQGHRLDSLGSVQIVGFRERRNVALGIYGVLVNSVSGGDPVVVGQAWPWLPDAAVAAVNLTDGQETIYPSVKAPGGYYGVGLSHRSADEFILTDSAGTVGIWHLWPAMVRLDTVPFALSPLRQVALLSDSIWLLTSSHYSVTRTETRTIVPLFALPTESPWQIFISPTKDRATLATVGGVGGAPVFDPLSGDTSYMIHGFSNVGWAGFSPDGSRLAVVGGRAYGYDDSLLVVRASDGQPVVSARLPVGVVPMTLAYDPVKPLLFVGAQRDSLPSVLIYDSNTLALLGELAGNDCGQDYCHFTGWSGAMAVDRSRNRLYVIWPHYPAPLWSFDLLP